MSRVGLSLTVLALVGALGDPSSPPLAYAQARPPARVVAVGDVHGSLEGLTAVLRAASLIDASGRWSGGSATFVQTGDLMDRGSDVRGVLDLMMALERDAPASGGRVRSLLGNHEVMNLLGEHRYVTPEICAPFAEADADGIRDRAWKEYERLQKNRARTRPGELTPAFGRTQEDWLTAYPRGCIEYRQAMSTKGSYGRWLRAHPIAGEAADSVFMHAGPDPTAATNSIAEMNDRATREITRFDRFLERLVSANLARPWFRFEDVLAVASAEVGWANARLTAAKGSLAPPDLSGIDIDLVREASDIVHIGSWSLLAENGPLWYRGYSTGTDEALAAPMAALLDRWKVRRLVVGHTVNPDFRIRRRFNGRLFLIDTGMLEPAYHGLGSALDISDGTTTALYRDGTRVALDPVP